MKESDNNIIITVIKKVIIIIKYKYIESKKE